MTRLIVLLALAVAAPLLVLPAAFAVALVVVLVRTADRFS